MQNKGGSGALADVDGYSTIGILTGGGAYVFEDYEAFEHQNPVFLHRHEYECDSAGPGRHRGGLGIRFEYETYAEDGQLVTFGEAETPPYGIGGGQAAPPSRITVHRDGETIVPLANEVVPVSPGTRIEMVETGGGGAGDPGQRDRELVRADVRAGLVSREAAIEDYGLTPEQLPGAPK